MAGCDERLRRILDGYAKCLREKDLALPKRQPYWVRWVKDCLLFAKEHGGDTVAITLEDVPGRGRRKGGGLNDEASRR